MVDRHHLCEKPSSPRVHKLPAARSPVAHRREQQPKTVREVPALGLPRLQGFGAFEVGGSGLMH